MEHLDLTSIKAAIFDMDGTMINNMPYHKKAWIEFCHKHGLQLSEEDFKAKFSGKKNDAIFCLLFNKDLSQEEIANYTEEKEALYRHLYAPAISEVPGLGQIIQILKDRGIRLAIATTAPKKNRDFVLRALQLEETFEFILGDEHVQNGKPNPEIYLETAKRLGVQPSECLVFEDSPPGVEAGNRAGMYVVGIMTTHTAEELDQADICVGSFIELTVD